MGLESLEQLGRIEKEVKLGDDITVKIHTLTVNEQQKALSSVPQDLSDEALKYTHLQISVLTQATVSINGEAIADKKVLRQTYEKMQYSVLSHLFSEYLNLTGDQTKIFDELKKN